ncbi:hypothetical protein PISL3812_05861 [Talaromyces islandicus]|uniref:Uncharacterized protein n=1 Tax=Talaromyces islandicus TaxID=28573 RepID=A0A0U1M121_TALIS|nr:hypothetical protein PISL3812_05861 [Talaromyces islandicus]
MPPPANVRAQVEPPEQITNEAVKGFATGALRFGSMSILAHLILVLPHPFTFDHASAPATTNTTHTKESTPHKKSVLSARGVRQHLFYRPLASLSESLGPTSRIYRGLTPQFKVFLHIAVMTLGGSIWAEKRVGEYMDMLRKKRRAERRMGVSAEE